MKTQEWYAEDLRRHREEMKRTSIGMMKEHYADVAAIAASKKYIEEADKRILARAAQRKASQVTESLKNAKPIKVVKPKTTKRKKQLEEMKSLHKEIKQTKIPNLSSLKRKHQLAEMEMLKKEVEHYKITYIKLDSNIEGMIIKLDAFAKSKTF